MHIKSVVIAIISRRTSHTTAINYKLKMLSANTVEDSAALRPRYCVCVFVCVFVNAKRGCFNMVWVFRFATMRLLHPHHHVMVLIGKAYYIFVYSNEALVVLTISI